MQLHRHVRFASIILTLVAVVAPTASGQDSATVGTLLNQLATICRETDWITRGRTCADLQTELRSVVRAIGDTSLVTLRQVRFDARRALAARDSMDIFLRSLARGRGTTIHQNAFAILDVLASGMRKFLVPIEPDLAVARVREDGVIVPLFQWRDSCVSPIARDNADRTLPTGWWFAPLRGPARAFRIGHRVTFPDDVMGYDGWGMLSNLTPRAAERHTYPVARVGMAVAPRTPVAIFRPLPTQSPLRAQLASWVAARFDSVLRSHPDFGARDPRTRDSVTVTYAAADPSTSVLIVHAQRRLAEQAGFENNRDCHWYLVFASFGIVRGSTISLLDRLSPADADDPDNPDSAFARTTCDHHLDRTPSGYGVFSANGGRYMLGALAGWEDESVMLLEIRNGKLVFPTIRELRP